MRRDNDIGACVRGALEAYFRDLDGETPSGIYDMVLKSIEQPMLEVTLRHAGGNQSRAAEMLGINRNTLRRKINEHSIEPFDPGRDAERLHDAPHRRVDEHRYHESAVS